MLFAAMHESAVGHKADIAVVSVNVRFPGRAEIEHPLLEVRFSPRRLSLFFI
jgi:hypothetical protein